MERKGNSFSQSKWWFSWSAVKKRIPKISRSPATDMRPLGYNGSYAPNFVMKNTRTERHIERGLRRLMDNRTTFVIAHRLSTVRNADAIMVLENGEIIERGNHDQLVEQKGRYYELYTGAVELD